jgi:hypothetical protein
VAISGATNQTFTATASGSYGCWVNVAACRDTTNCISVTITNSTLDFSENAVQIYPNPSSGLVNVNVPENSTIVVRDIKGSIYSIQKVNAGTHLLHMDELKSGIYYIQFTSSSWQITKSLILNPE